MVSIWTVAGRERISFVCDERTAVLLEHRRGESDLVYREGNWFLLATVEVEEPPPGTPEDWLGVDLGIKNIAADSAGETYSGGHLRGLRHRYGRVRSRLQSKGTKSAKRLAKKRRRREHRMARDTNHRISKRIVEKAKRTKSGIALEDLQGIRGRVRARRSQRSTLHSWSFGQLRSFIEYKARLAGVPVVFVDPRNTSRTCPKCGHCDKRSRPNRDTFCCTACGFAGPADSIAAENIRSAHVTWCRTRLRLTLKLQASCFSWGFMTQPPEDGSASVQGARNQHHTLNLFQIPDCYIEGFDGVIHHPSSPPFAI